MKPYKQIEPAWIFHKARIDAGVMFHRYKAAAVSFRPRKWDKASNADRFEAFARDAAKQGANVLVGPEGTLEGYVISDVTWNRERVEAFIDLAEPLDGPYIRRFRKLAKSLRMCLCFGFAERQWRDVYNSAMFIDHRGAICGVHRKVTETTHPSWNFARQADHVRAFDTPLGRAGMLICSDRWMPLLARTLVLDGARLILIPTYGSTERSQSLTVLARARENGVPIVQANVGMAQIISKGEVVIHERGLNRITTGFIDVPVAPSPQAVRACDRELQRVQPIMQRDYYRSLMKRIKKGARSKDVQRALVPQREFEALRKSRWGEKAIRKAEK